MARRIVNSGDYSVTAGTGVLGVNTITLDAANVRIPGKLTVEGTQTVINSTTLTVDDPFIEVIRNNSGSDLDGGIYVNRGGTGNNAVMFWDEGDDVFKMGTTTNNASTSPLTNLTLAKLQVAEPSATSDVATKNYVDVEIGSITGATFAVDDSSTVTAASGNTLYLKGGSNINTVGNNATDTITISLDNDLTGITSITSDASNGDLTLTANGTGEIVLNDILTFTVGTANPTATTSTKMYNKTAAGGGTGLYFKNSNIDSGAEGELISKKKATALAIALG
jgi:hypothetical protein